MEQDAAIRGRGDQAIDVESCGSRGGGGRRGLAGSIRRTALAAGDDGQNHERGEENRGHSVAASPNTCLRERLRLLVST